MLGWSSTLMLLLLLSIAKGHVVRFSKEEDAHQEPPAPNEVKIDWSTPIAISKLTASLQVVVNPLLRQESPVHDAMYKSLAELGADYVRYVPWKPYPQLAVAELEPPSGPKQCRFITGTQNTSEFVHLYCGAGLISKVDFASFGNPTGFCGDLKQGSCHAKTSQKIVEDACIGREICTILVNTKTFGDPCPGTEKGFAAQIDCKPPINHTSWNFALINPMMEDFMNATNNHSVIINFSTIPEWMYVTADRVKYPDDPNQISPGYSAAKGTVLRDPTGQEVGDYFGRLVSWYTKGGFIDEYGIQHHSPFKYDFQYWECLNEVNGEHQNTPESYTHIYDQMVLGIRRHADPDHKIKFVGLATGGYTLYDWYTYFLNKSNHVSDDIPLDVMSFHFYCSCANRTDPINYQDFFPSADGLVEAVERITKIRDALSPHTLLDIDETGVILPHDNDRDAPMFPLVYYNAAGAMYAYLFGKLAVAGLDILGESQLVGNPALPELNLPPQYPSVAMLNWTNGLGNARYHVLKTLIENFKPGDKLVNTTVILAATPSQSDEFCGKVLNLKSMSLSCNDAEATISKIPFASYGTVQGYECGDFKVGTCNAANSSDIVEKACLGKHSCTVEATTPIFGDPCVDVVKHLVIEAKCSTGGGTATGDQSAAKVYAQAFTASDNTNRRLLLVNKTPFTQNVHVLGVTGDQTITVDETRPTGPAVVARQTSDVITMLRYAVVVVIMHT